jgi:hypothetical protein
MRLTPKQRAALWRLSRVHRALRRALPARTLGIAPVVLAALRKAGLAGAAYDPARDRTIWHITPAGLDWCAARVAELESAA